VLCYPLESHIIIDITSRRFEWAKRCVYSSCTSSIRMRFSLFASLPHPLLSYTHLTPELTIYIFNNVFQSILVYAVLCISGTRGNAVAYGRIMRCYSCVRYVVCVYYFLLLVHFLCRLSPLG